MASFSGITTVPATQPGLADRDPLLSDWNDLEHQVFVHDRTLPGSQEIGSAGTAGSVSSHVANVNVGRSNRRRHREESDLRQWQSAFLLVGTLAMVDIHFAL